MCFVNRIKFNSIVTNCCCRCYKDLFFESKLHVYSEKQSYKKPIQVFKNLIKMLFLDVVLYFIVGTDALIWLNERIVFLRT